MSWIQFQTESLIDRYIFNGVTPWHIHFKYVLSCVSNVDFGIYFSLAPIINCSLNMNFLTFCTLDPQGL